MRALLFVLMMVVPSAFVHAGLVDIEEAMMNKDYALVKQMAQEMLKDSHDSALRMEAQYYLGLAQLRLGQYTEARKSFGVAMHAAASKPGAFAVNTADPNDLYDKSVLGLIEALYMSGSYKEAVSEGEKLLRKSPNSQFLSLTYLKLARANLKMMRWADATGFLARIIQDFPQSVEAPIAKQLLEEKEYFTVQVGSFLERGRAMSLTNELKAAGQYAYIVETISPDGRKFYRVRVGQMSSLKDAQGLEQSLAKLGYPTLIYP